MTHNQFHSLINKADVALALIYVLYNYDIVAV